MTLGKALTGSFISVCSFEYWKSLSYLDRRPPGEGAP